MTHTKTIKTLGVSANGRKFSHNTTFEAGNPTPVCQSIEYLATEKVGSISLYVRQGVTTAEAWHYMRTGNDSGKKIFAT
jgi:hypothetical protein